RRFVRSPGNGLVACVTSDPRVPPCSALSLGFMILAVGLAIAAATLLATLAFASPAHADDSGVSPTRLKLPSGPGSLEGVGENAEANLNMGLVTYAVPF